MTSVQFSSVAQSCLQRVMTQRSEMGQVGGSLKKEGIYVYLGLIHAIVQQKLTQHFKAIILQFRRRRWHPTPVLLPGKSHGQRSLIGCSPWGRWELDTTERLHFHFSLSCIGEGNGNPLQCSCWRIQGQGSLVGCCPWGRTESDTTKVTQQQQQQHTPIKKQKTKKFENTDW